MQILFSKPISSNFASTVLLGLLAVKIWSSIAFFVTNSSVVFYSKSFRNSLIWSSFVIAGSLLSILFNALNLFEVWNLSCKLLAGLDVIYSLAIPKLNIAFKC